MGIYDSHVLPHLINLACGAKPIAKQRQKVVPRARGVVLEVGFGTGLNLPYYDVAAVTRLYALEPSRETRKLAARRVAASALAIEFLDLPGEDIPLEPACVDTVVVTYTLCTIADVGRALEGMRRVLKPEGRLLFSEHGLAPDAGVARWQNRLAGVWSALSGGCRLNRPIDRLITDAGFVPESLESAYLPGPKFASYHYWGAARPA